MGKMMGWKHVLPVGVLAMWILGCTGAVSTDGKSADGADAGDDDDEKEGEDDKDDVPEGVDVENSGRWVPEKGSYTYTLTLESGGEERTALVHAPRGAKAKKLPVVLAFHGGKGGNGADKMTSYFDDVETGDAVVVFPNGLPGGTRSWAGAGDDRDLEFVDDLLDELDERVGIDRDHLYATGFSNGAAFTWNLQCERSSVFAGFGHVQHAMDKDLASECKPKDHRPFVWFHGDKDDKAKWEGSGDVLGVPETLEKMLELDECRGKPDRVDTLKNADKSDGTLVIHQQFRSCKAVSAIDLYRVQGGGHAWPIAEGKAKEGRSRDIDAGELTIAFWTEHAGLKL